jgi:hypothetical protein
MRNLFLLFLLAIPFLGCDQQDTAPNLDGKYIEHGIRISMNGKVIKEIPSGGYVSYTLELHQGNFIIDYKSDDSSETGIAKGNYTLTKASIYNQYKITLKVIESTTFAYPVAKVLEFTDVSLLPNAFSSTLLGFPFQGPGLTYYYTQKDLADYDHDGITEENNIIQIFYQRINS